MDPRNSLQGRRGAISMPLTTGRCDAGRNSSPRPSAQSIELAPARAGSRGPANGRPAVSVLSGRILAEECPHQPERKARELVALKEEIGARGGKLEVVEIPGVGLRVLGELPVSAGSPAASRMIRAPKGSMVVSRSNTMDEALAGAAVGYGMGALSVTYQVKGRESRYVISTNGSLACLAERELDVAKALVGAAEIVEKSLCGYRDNVVVLKPASAATPGREPTAPSAMVACAASGQ